MDITLERILSLIPRKPDGTYVHGEKAKFADNLGMARNLVTMWESGQSQSYRNKLHEIAAKYDVSVEWLKGETDEKNPPVDTEGEKAALLASLEDMSNEELISLIRRASEILTDR